MLDQFTCTENLIKFVREDSNTLVIMAAGDKLSIPANQSEQFCEAGWGTSDKYSTGERVEGIVSLKPKKTNAKATSPSPE